LDGVPTFVRRRPLTFAALRFALRAHGDDWREADGAPFILHPLEVASLLHSFDCSDEVTAAAVLHDTLETTNTTRGDRALLRRHRRAPRVLPDRGRRHRGRAAAQVRAARAGRWL
jgi:hypothetical protein